MKMSIEKKSLINKTNPTKKTNIASNTRPLVSNKTASKRFVRASKTLEGVIASKAHSRNGGIVGGGPGR
jgi:penicillin V acylase-like amidase (Ntn superfamily)